MSKWGEKMKNMIESVDNFLGTVRHTLITKGMWPTIGYTAKSLAALLSYKEAHQSGKKTERIIEYTEEKLNTFLNYLDEKNALLEAEIKQDIETKINECTLEHLNEAELTIEQIKCKLEEIEDADWGKEMQLKTDLKRTDARMCWYLEKFNDLWIVFEDEDTLNRNLCMLCGLDSKLEPWIQEKLKLLIEKAPNQQN